MGNEKSNFHEIKINSLLNYKISLIELIILLKNHK